MRLLTEKEDQPCGSKYYTKNRKGKFDEWEVRQRLIPGTTVTCNGVKTKVYQGETESEYYDKYKDDLRGMRKNGLIYVPE